MKTVSGWIVLPRDLHDKISHLIKEYVTLSREYGKAIDLVITKMPNEVFDKIALGKGVVHSITQDD